MVDSEDEHYVTFGTPLDPLDEDNLPRKKPVTIEDQYACDEQGRRRFHGAFTGGFSAGYFNTVGTRDGWRPQQFKSSRSSKAENKAQRPQDFMDDEDMGQFGIAPTAIRATSDYTEHEKKGSKRERTRCAGDGPIPGTPVLRELLKPVRDTVGVKLLKQMGWKPGQGVGPRLSKREKSKIKQQNAIMKTYGCPLPPDQAETMETDSAGSDDEDGTITFAPDDYEPFRCNPKDNFFGIGYSGLDKRPILSQHVTLFEAPQFKLQEKNKKLSIRGQAFGVGAFEAEDEDIYSRDDMSQYDFSLEPQNKQKSRWSQEKPTTSQNKCIEGFRAARNHIETRKIFKPPEIPKGFKPVHVIRKSRFEPTIESTSLELARRKGLARHDLKAEDRARIINDPNPITLVLSNTGKSESSKVSDSTESQKHSGDNCLFPCVMAGEQVKPVPGSRENDANSSSPQPLKKPSVISNIITKTLNLHGRDQISRNQEQCADNLRSNNEVAHLKNVKPSSSSASSWLEKLNVKSFVKGGTEKLTLSDEVLQQTPTTDTSQSVCDLDSQIAEKKPDETGTDLDSQTQSSTFKPFIANLDKQRRYEQFLAFRESGEIIKLGTIQPLSMTEWEMEHERVEFEQAARLYKPLTGNMGDRFVSGKHQDDMNPLNEVEGMKDADAQLRDAASKKMFGKLTRQRMVWQPASILCKRFNIAEPSTGCAKPETDRKTKFSVFDYLEESVHNSSTFQSATDMAVRIKSENSNGVSTEGGPRKILAGSYRSLATQAASNSAMFMCDKADKNKASAKEHDFEVKYERIFGRNVNALEETVKDGSDRISPDIQRASNSKESTPPTKTSIDSIEESGNPPEPSGIIDETGSPEILVVKSNEKKDLFKAIFLSSSEDSDSDGDEELDNEKLKSLLIGKNPGELNVQRNTSPPRGIFANLDLDSLNDVSSKSTKINFIDRKNSLGSVLSEAPASDKNKKTSENTSAGNLKESENSLEIKTESEILPDMYGPVLPAKPAKILQNAPEPDSSDQSQSQKLVFKSIIVPVVNQSRLSEGEWIEKRKDKKSKKEKKKHKHKEHKKHKHKKHKR